MRVYQDGYTGETMCEVKKGNTTVHRQAIVTINDRHAPSHLGGPLHTVEPKLFSGERLFITMLDMEIIQEQSNEQRPRSPYDSFGLETFYPF